MTRGFYSRAGARAASWMRRSPPAARRVTTGQAAATGLRDPREVLAPVVDAALALRRVVRAEKRYDLSDLLRDELAAAGVAVRDTPDGVVWELTG